MNEVSILFKCLTCGYVASSYYHEKYEIFQFRISTFNPICPRCGEESMVLAVVIPKQHKDESVGEIC